MYTIYHVYGVKIGLTKYYPQRIYDQNLQDLPHGIEDQVSKECGIEFAEKIEKFWQWYYGLEELHDNLPYSKTEEYGRKGGNKGIKSQLEKGIHSSQTGKSGIFQLTTEQKLKAQKLGGLAANGAGLKAALASGRHSTQLGISGYQTMTPEKHSEVGKSAMASPNHNTKQIHTCPRCGRTGSGFSFLGNHINKGTIRCPLEDQRLEAPEIIFVAD